MNLLAFVVPLIVLAVVAFIDGHLLPLRKARRDAARRGGASPLKEAPLPRQRRA
jgi:hypothetical protein